MTSLSLSPTSRFSRFDKAVFLTILAALALTAVFIWRGDRVGVTAVQFSPTNDATEVSTRAVLRVVFGQPMVTDGQPRITTNPPMAGETAWEQGVLVFRPQEEWQPDTTYTVQVEPGLQSTFGRQLLRPISWQFQTGQPRILYISWQSGSTNQLYITPPDGIPTRLTDEPGGVVDYAISPDGQQIVYSAMRDDGGSDLWKIAPDGNGRSSLLVCNMAACTQPVWSPDGTRLLYERREIATAGAPPGAPRLWWLDPANGQTVPLFQDSQWLGLGARFSADGRWVAYISPITQAIQAYNLESGQTVSIPSKTGEPPVWSPVDNTLLINEIVFQGERFSVYLFQVDLETVSLTNISGEDIEVQDSFAVFSPDGSWIALGRKLPRTAMGKQLWLMSLDGSQTVELTNNADMHFGQPAWSPNGRFLAAQRYLLSEIGAQPGIWLIDIETKELREVASPGVQPGWVP